MLIVLIAKKGFGFGIWIRFNYSRIVYYSELPIPNIKVHDLITFTKVQKPHRKLCTAQENFPLKRNCVCVAIAVFSS